MSDMVILDQVEHQLIWGCEKWLLSAHPNGDSIVTNTNMLLSELFHTQPELFGRINSNEFPLLIKHIIANDRLSVQVHPDDQYSRKNENSLGKSECWYILASSPGSTIVIDQNTESREELAQLIDQGQVEKALLSVEVKAGDFFYIPPGTVHAIGQGIEILEIQQSSDITYRLYDYNRVDDHGLQRELHIDKALDVINFTHRQVKQTFPLIENRGNIIKTLIRCSYFNVFEITVKEHFSYQTEADFICCIPLTEAVINGQKIKKLQAVIITRQVKVEMSGKIIFAEYEEGQNV